MAELTDRLVEHGELMVSNEVREQLKSVSARRSTGFWVGTRTAV